MMRVLSLASFAFFAVVFALVPFVYAFHKPNVAVTCTSYSWWILFPLDASIVDPWVPSEFSFIPTSSLPAAFSSLPANKRMVTLEFNKQTDCFTKALPFVKTTFTEFKVQVPFLNANNFANRAPLMYKPVIYADNLINAIGGSLQYGLKTVFAENMPYDVNNGLYTVNYDGEQIKGQFIPQSEWFSIRDLSSSSFAHEYIPMHEKTEWLGHDVWGRTRCAKHYYKWDQTRIRWVNASIHFGEGMVGGNSPAFDKNVLGDDVSKFVTAFQIETVHDINNLEKCSIINPNIFNIVWESNEERVFDVSQVKNENGTPVIMWNPNGGNNQKFEWVAGEQLRWVGTDKCLDVKDGNNVNGNVIFMWECARRNDNPNQKFVRVGHMIQWKDTNKCLGVVNGSTDAGTRVAIYECDENNPAQQFAFQP